MKLILKQVKCCKECLYLFTDSYPCMRCVHPKANPPLFKHNPTVFDKRQDLLKTPDWCPLNDSTLLDDIIYSMNWMMTDIDYRNELNDQVEESDDMKKAKETLEKLKGLKNGL